MTTHPNVRTGEAGSLGPGGAEDRDGGTARDLAARLPTEQHAQAAAGRVKDKGFDLRHWLSDHGVGVRSEKPYSGGTLFILDQCPFSSAHKDGAFAIQFGNGAVFAGCKHTSCGGGTQRWQELRERYRAGPGNKEEGLGAETKDLAEGPGESRKLRTKVLRSPAPVPANPDARAAALDVLEHGDPVALMLTAFAQEHVGDEILWPGA